MVWLVSVYCYVKQEEAISAAKNERSRLDQRSDDATDAITPPLDSNAPKSPEKTDAPPPPSPPVLESAVNGDGTAEGGTGRPVNRNVENLAGSGNDSGNASGSPPKDGKPAENDGKSTNKLEKPSPGAEPKPDENAAGVKKPDEPGNVDNEPANPLVADETPQEPSLNKP